MHRTHDLSGSGKFESSIKQILYKKSAKTKAVDKCDLIFRQNFDRN